MNGKPWADLRSSLGIRRGNDYGPVPEDGFVGDSSNMYKFAANSRPHDDQVHIIVIHEAAFNYSVDLNVDVHNLIIHNLETETTPHMTLRNLEADLRRDLADDILDTQAMAWYALASSGRLRLLTMDDLVLNVTTLTLSEHHMEPPRPQPPLPDGQHPL